MVLDHFTEKSFHRKNLTERPFDQNTIWPNTVWPNAIWPKVRSTESPFDRKFILLKGHMTDFLFRKWSFDQIYFQQKMSIDRKKLRTRSTRLTENSFDRKLIWPKAFSENDHLTDRSFDRKFIWPKAFLETSSQDVFVLKNFRFRKNFILPTVRIPFGQMTIFRKKFSVKWTFGHMSFRSFD
jgi:hypothetical protein